MLFLLSSVAVWRLAYMLQDETGPWRIFEKIREHINNSNKPTLIEGFQCFYCLSVWVAIPFAIYLAADIWQFFVYPLSLSALAVALNMLHLKFA